jgi:hypothetical protein
MKQFVRDERDRRQEYKDSSSMFLPSSFCPGLKEQVPDLKLDGKPFEFDFPNFPEVVSVLESPFKQSSSVIESGTDNETKLRL